MILLRKPEALDIAFPFSYNLRKVRTIDRLVIDGELYPLGVLVDIFRGNVVNCSVGVTGNRPEDRLQTDLLEYARDAVECTGIYGRAAWMGCGYPEFVVHHKETDCLILYSWNYCQNDKCKDDGYMLATLLDPETLDLVRVVDQFRFNKITYTGLNTCLFPITIKDSNKKFFRKVIDTKIVHNLKLHSMDSLQFERHREVVKAINKELRVSAAKIEVDVSHWNFPNDWSSIDIFYFIVGGNFDKFLKRIKRRC